jgi:hypothetical protein
MMWMSHTIRISACNSMGLVLVMGCPEVPPPPPRTAELRRESRLARIAKALASGATVTDIAEAERIARTREANSPECRQLIAAFVGDERQACKFLDIPDFDPF